MHELGIVFHIIDTLEEVAKQQHLSAISSVTLEVGEVSAVIDEYLQDCWKWATGRTHLLKGAALQVQVLPAVTLCENCGHSYGTVAHGRICPRCGSELTHLVTGREINLKEIAAC